MFYFLYDILLFFLYLLYMPIYALRGRMHGDILTRLGLIKKGTFDVIGDRETVWIHAVSVGEARAAESLVRLIRSCWPQKCIVVSTVTPTGHAIAKKILKEGEVVFYTPFDISFSVSRFLKVIRPSLLIIMETEIWPNLIRLAKRSGANVAIVNGRISDQSFKRYKRISVLLKETLDNVDLFCMQNREAEDRILALGADGKRVKVTGNIKFDISAGLSASTVLQNLKSAVAGSMLFIAASTHENEEDGIVTIYKSLRKDFPSLRLLIAPRHLERIDKIRRMIRLQGLEAFNVSRLPRDKAVQAGNVDTAQPAGVISSTRVLILDTVGDLSAIYSLCDVAYVGGSLVPHGGHNPIEPALFGKPILFGKHMHNFREIRDVFIRENAAVEVDSMHALEYELRKLLASSSERKALGARAQGLIDRNRGAALRTFSVIEDSFKC